ncbi:MAG: hypothetical protein CL687_03700 [Candidatus Pelagibacter sp.]|nr:hypothetical protein [Candidatus Pelagibacter sp.]OUW23729.1 MAG: hypothetical protein CBD34_02325 [Rickettsiales bacterium TMED174]
MEKNQIIILENRGTISVTGDDAEDFLQNLITNDIKKVTKNNSIFSALLTPQGKYLNEFFIIKLDDGYILDCIENSTDELIEILSKYKLRSKIKITDLSSNYVVGIISSKKFRDLQIEVKSNDNTILFRDTPIFSDPRRIELGARIFSSLEKLYLSIKKLNLEIVESSKYYSLAFRYGIPEKGLENLKNQLFGLEANLENLQAIDFKKGCFIGQENTARMKLKNKLRRRLLGIKTSEKLNLGDDIIYNNTKIGKILINTPYSFGLIKMFDPSFEEFENKELLISNKKCKILKSI